MSHINHATHAVLRRRAKDLLELGAAVERGDTLAAIEDRWLALCSPERVGVLARAADELEVYTRMQTEPETVALELLADNRRLRKALREVVELTRITDVPVRNKSRVEAIVRGALGATRPPGEAVQLFVVEVTPGQPRALLESVLRRELAAWLDRQFDTVGPPGSTD